jgi:acetylornithine/N-succinyldiaminopimelate aminotransferase
MAATGKPGFDALFPPAMTGFRKVPYADLGAVERAVSAQTAAVLVEPIQGEAGVVVPPPGYLAGLRALADRDDLLLIADEVQTGLHRTGPFLAADSEPAIRPDIVTLGKALGGGVPISALLCTRRAGSFAPGEQGGTFHNSPLGAAAALAVLDCVESPDFLPAVTAGSEQLRAALARIAARSGAALRGRGHLWALELPTALAHAVRDACFARGLLVNAAQPNVVRLMPSLRTTGSEIDAMESLLAEALASQRLCG